MDSKKLGMIAAAALTVLATNAQANEADKAAKADVGVCVSKSCGGANNKCKGEVIPEHKDKTACTADPKGLWKTSAKAPAQDTHAHPAKK